MVRAFVAVEIEPTQEILSILSEIDGLGLRIKTVERESMHLTLKFLGEIDERVVKKISEGMRSLEKYPSFSMHLEGVGAFPSERRAKVIWIGIERSERLKDIWKEIENIAENCGIAREKRDFSPHLTLGRVKDPRDSGRVRKVLEAHRDEDFGAFDVKEIKLKKSVLTPQGPIYSDISVVELKGNPQS